MYKSAMFGENKSMELQIDTREDPSWGNIGASVAWTRKRDHAGFNFDIGLWKWVLYFSIRDTRHWDEENNDWEYYPTDPEEARLKWERDDSARYQELINAVVRKKREK